MADGRAEQENAVEMVQRQKNKYSGIYKCVLTHMRESRSLERFQFVYIAASSILGEKLQKVPITCESNKQNVSARIFNHINQTWIFLLFDSDVVCLFFFRMLFNQSTRTPNAEHIHCACDIGDS